MINRDKERQRQTDRQTDRNRQTDRDRQREKVGGEDFEEKYSPSGKRTLPLQREKDFQRKSTARVMQELLCRHGCLKIQINVQGREFINQTSTRVKAAQTYWNRQKVTSTYALNCLC